MEQKKNTENSKSRPGADSLVHLRGADAAQPPEPRAVPRLLRLHGSEPGPRSPTELFLGHLHSIGARRATPHRTVRLVIGWEKNEDVTVPGC